MHSAYKKMDNYMMDCSAVHYMEDYMQIFLTEIIYRKNTLPVNTRKSHNKFNEKYVGFHFIKIHSLIVDTLRAVELNSVQR